MRLFSWEGELLLKVAGGSKVGIKRGRNINSEGNRGEYHSKEKPQRYFIIFHRKDAPGSRGRA